MAAIRPGIGKDMGWQAAWIIVAMLLVSGCANVSRYQSGSVVAYGERLGGAAEPLYYAIRLDQDGVIDAHAGGWLAGNRRTLPVATDKTAACRRVR